MRFVGGARTKGALDEAIAGDIGRPGFGEGSAQSGQDRVSGERALTRIMNRIVMSPFGLLSCCFVCYIILVD